MLDTHKLFKALQSGVDPESSLFESMGLKAVLEKDVKEMTEGELKKNISDLSSRLHYCSDTGEGHKVRKELESRIQEMEKELQKRSSEGKVPDPSAQTAKKIEALREESSKLRTKLKNLMKKKEHAEKQLADAKRQSDKEEIDDWKNTLKEIEFSIKAVKDEMKKKGIKEQEELPPEDATAPKPQVEPTPEPEPEQGNVPAPASDQGQPEMTPLDKQLNDLVANITSAREHFDKGNLKVASELIKLVSDDIKTFKDAIKMKKETAKPAPAEEGKESGKSGTVSEQDTYTVIARGISDEEVAKKIAADRKGVVMKDENDEKKFQVVMKEAFSAEEVEAIVKEAKSELEAIKNEKANEAEARELKLKTLAENFEELVNALAQVSKKGKEELSETIQTLDEKKKEIVEAIGNLAMLKEMQVKGLQADLLKELLEKKKEEKGAR